MFAYCNNNPVTMADKHGQMPFLVLTGLLGAVGGGIMGYCSTGSLEGALSGAAIGGLAGMGLGAVSGMFLAGSAIASTTAVITGVSSLSSVVSGAGVAAGGAMLADNFYQSIVHAPQVFWAGGDLAKNNAQQLACDISGITLDMTRLGQKLTQMDAGSNLWEAGSQNFANVANNAASSIYAVQSISGVSIDSIWARIEYPLIQHQNIIYHIVGSFVG